MAVPYRGVLFDLFGTLIGFEPARLPELTVGTERVRSTIGGLVDELGEWVPAVAPAAFLQALRAVSEEMAHARTRDHVELPSRERFRRALARVGCADEVVREAAVHLSRAHMGCLAAATVLPAGHAELIATLRPRFRLGVVSNFDDTATAYEILRRHGLLEHLDAVVVSEAVGLRKPHPAPLRAAVRALGLAPTEVLFVGDTFGEDVAAARAAGVDAAWIDHGGHGVPTAAAPPRHVVRTLPELGRLLEVS